MNPPPLPPAPRMTPTQRILARLTLFFLAFFSIRFPIAFFINFGFDLGPKNPPKSHPGPKKCVPGGYFLQLLVRAGVLCIFRLIWGQKTTKNWCLFGWCFWCGAFCFPTRQPLILLTGAALLRVFRIYEKHIFSQTNTKIVYKTDHQKTSWNMSAGDHFWDPKSMKIVAPKP